jgi:hypothetical protein
MWFTKPKNWTIFDRYAADGLGVPGSAESGKRMLDFYKVLHDREIPKTWEAMQGLINCRALKGLPATRIVDSFLMSKGGRGGDDKSIRLAKFAMGLLSKEMANNVHDLALEIQDNFASQLNAKLK